MRFLAQDNKGPKANTIKLNETAEPNGNNETVNLNQQVSLIWLYLILKVLMIIILIFLST